MMSEIKRPSHPPKVWFESKAESRSYAPLVGGDDRHRIVRDLVLRGVSKIGWNADDS